MCYVSLDSSRPPLHSAVDWHRVFFPLEPRGQVIFWLVFAAWMPWAMLYEAWRLKPEKIIAFGSFYALLFWPTAKLVRSKLILFLRLGLVPRGRLSIKQNLQQWLDRIGLGIAHNLICMSESMRREVELFCPKAIAKVKVLPNDISTPHYAETRSGAPGLVAVTTGYLVRRKNIDFLLEVFAILQAHTPASQWRLWIVGDGPDRARLEAEMRRRKLMNVEFLGWHDDVFEVLSSARLLLHASLQEGMPNSVMEALGFGMPVLAMQVPEIKELLFYEELLFSPTSPDSLAEALIEAEQNQEVIEHWRALCEERRRVFSFDWDKLACELVCA